MIVHGSLYKTCRTTISRAAVCSDPFRKVIGSLPGIPVQTKLDLMLIIPLYIIYKMQQLPDLLVDFSGYGALNKREQFEWREQYLGQMTHQQIYDFCF